MAHKCFGLRARDQTRHFGQRGPGARLFDDQGVIQIEYCHHEHLRHSARGCAEASPAWLRSAITWICEATQRYGSVRPASSSASRSDESTSSPGTPVSAGMASLKTLTPYHRTMPNPTDARQHSMSSRRSAAAG